MDKKTVIHLHNAILLGHKKEKLGEKGGQKETAWGTGHMTQCANDVLLNCTLETCVVLQTNVTPINSIKSS